MQGLRLLLVPQAFPCLVSFQTVISQRLILKRHIAEADPQASYRRG
jgi:hypothetical protein